MRPQVSQTKEPTRVMRVKEILEVNTREINPSTAIKYFKNTNPTEKVFPKYIPLPLLGEYQENARRERNSCGVGNRNTEYKGHTTIMLKEG